jgi:nitroreductase
MVDAIEAIKTRRSVRSYGPDPVPTEIVEDIIDCARFAPTGRGEEPWEFVVVTDERTRKKIADIAQYGRFIATAAVCVAVFCRDTTYYIEDGSAATQNILLAAHAHGLGSCWVAGDKKPYASEMAKLLGVPAGYKLVSLVAIGHPLETPQKDKRPLEKVLHWERF